MLISGTSLDQRMVKSLMDIFLQILGIFSQIWRVIVVVKISLFKDFSSASKIIERRIVVTNLLQLLGSYSRFFFFEKLAVELELLNLSVCDVEALLKIVLDEGAPGQVLAQAYRILLYHRYELWRVIFFIFKLVIRLIKYDTDRPIRRYFSPIISL